MKRNYLLPHVFKQIGLWTVLPFAGICLFYLITEANTTVWPCQLFAVYAKDISTGMWFQRTQTDLLLILGMAGFLASLTLIAFSREKEEDECIEHIRLKSLIWALFVSAVVLLIGILFLYGFAYMFFCFAYPYCIYLLYIAKFHGALHRFKVSEVQ